MVMMNVLVIMIELVMMMMDMCSSDGDKKCNADDECVGDDDSDDECVQ